jgi:hypothetical protein
VEAVIGDELGQNFYVLEMEDGTRQTIYFQLPKETATIEMAIADAPDGRTVEDLLAGWLDTLQAVADEAVRTFGCADDAVDVQSTRGTAPSSAQAVRDAIRSLEPTYPDIECSIGSNPSTGIINGIRVGSRIYLTTPQFQLAVHAAIAQTGIDVPPVIFSTTGI